MGNNLTKLTCSKPSCVEEFDDVIGEKNKQQPLKFKQTQDQEKKLRSLKPEQREKLKELFQHILSNAPIDFTSKEIQDIQKAVNTMLDRIKTRVNRRCIFSIARIIPGGSMAEKTSVWKFGGFDNYLEFDFLAVLEKCIKECVDQSAQNNCGGCINIVNPPLELENLRQYHDKEEDLNAEILKSKDVISNLFLKEINYCLTSSCNCLNSSLDFFPIHSKGIARLISFAAASIERENGCEICTVKMPTGTLSVNTEKTIAKDFSGPDNCSLIFLWESKAESLLAPEKWLLEEPEPIFSLPIYVDFLPALDSLKPAQSGSGDEHDYFIVPKECNTCIYDDDNDDDYDDNYEDDDHDVDDAGDDCTWRKSWCMAEINAFTSEMSYNHRRCYKIMKYMSEIAWPNYIESYHIKTIALRHHINCLDTSGDCVDCVIGMYLDLQQAYETNKLLSHQSNLNIISWRYFHPIKETVKLLNLLFSVSGADTWDTFIRKIKTLLYHKTGSSVAIIPPSDC